MLYNWEAERWQTISFLPANSVDSAGGDRSLQSGDLSPSAQCGEVFFLPAGLSAFSLMYLFRSLSLLSSVPSPSDATRGKQGEATWCHGNRLALFSASTSPGSHLAFAI